MPKALINGININYEVAGEGFPLVLSPGGGTLEPLKQAGIFEALSQRYRTIIYDRRYYGESDAPLEPHSVETWMEDLRGLLEHLEASPACVWGSSEGASFTMLLAARHPNLVKALIVAAPTGGAYLEEFAYTPAWEDSAQYAESHGMDAVVDNPEGPYGRRIRSDPAFGEFLRRVPAVEYAAAVRESVRRLFGHGYPTVGVSQQELARISAPTLIMPGRDEWHPRLVARHIAQSVPGAEIRDVPAWAEDPQAFVEAVVSFLSRFE